MSWISGIVPLRPQKYTTAPPSSSSKTWQTQSTALVDLHAPLLGLLEPLEPRVVVDPLGLAHALEHVLDAGHHPLEAAEVNDGAVVELVEHLVGVLLDLVLDVHLAALLVVLLPRQGVVQAEVVGVPGLGVLELVVVEEGVAVGDAEEEPGLALVGVGGGRVLEEQAADEAAEGSNARAGRNHDVVGRGVLLGEEHDLPGGTRHHNFITGRRVAEEVGADALLGRVVGLELGAPVGGAADAQRAGGTRHVVAVTGGGDGVEADGVGLSVLLASAWGDDAPGLSLNVGEVPL